mmetsp:Transcript_65316/g.181621  ORF Transcript_65316/g.181621 Transcript_65316/m.181621 type:complete len:252 (-) Transcript_65316:400-1155(-)
MARLPPRRRLRSDNNRSSSPSHSSPRRRHIPALPHASPIRHIRSSNSLRSRRRRCINCSSCRSCSSCSSGSSGSSCSSSRRSTIGNSIKRMRCRRWSSPSCSRRRLILEEELLQTCLRRWRSRRRRHRHRHRPLRRRCPRTKPTLILRLQEVKQNHLCQRTQISWSIVSGCCLYVRQSRRATDLISCGSGLRRRMRLRRVAPVASVPANLPRLHSSSRRSPPAAQASELPQATPAAEEQPLQTARMWTPLA